MRSFWTDSQSAWEIAEDRNKDTARELSRDPDAQQPRLERRAPGTRGGRTGCARALAARYSLPSPFTPMQTQQEAHATARNSCLTIISSTYFIDEMLFSPAVRPWAQKFKRLQYWKLTVSTSDLHQASPLLLLHLPSWALRPALL